MPIPAFSAEATPDLRRSTVRRWLTRAALVLLALVTIPVTGIAILWSRADASNVGRL